MRNGLSMKLVSLTTIILLGTFFSPSHSYANSCYGNMNDSDGEYYFSYHFGAQSTGDLEDSETFTTGMFTFTIKEKQQFSNYDATAGFAFGKSANNIRYELQFLFIRSIISNIDVTVPTVPDLGMGPTSGTANTFGGLVNFLYDFKPGMNSPINGYIGGGFGYGQINTSATLEAVSDDPDFPGGSVMVSAKDKAFLYQFILGAMYNFSDKASVFVDFRHIGSSSFNFASVLNAVQETGINATIFDFKDTLAVNSVNIGITRFFDQ